MEIDQKDHETDVLHVVSEFADVPLCFVIEDWEVGPEVLGDVKMLVTQQHLLIPSGTSPGKDWKESKAHSLAGITKKNSRSFSMRTRGTCQESCLVRDK